jgi:hypothetical protein
MILLVRAQSLLAIHTSFSYILHVDLSVLGVAMTQQIIIYTILWLQKSEPNADVSNYACSILPLPIRRSLTRTRTLTMFVQSFTYIEGLKFGSFVLTPSGLCHHGKQHKIGVDPEQSLFNIDNVCPYVCPH